MSTLSIYNVINKNSAILHSDGLSVYARLSEMKNSSSEEIVVDFKNLEHITTAFLNACVGKIIQEDNSILDRLKFDNTPENLGVRLKRVITLATDEKKRLAHNEALEELMCD